MFKERLLKEICKTKLPHNPPGISFHEFNLLVMELTHGNSTAWDLLAYPYIALTPEFTIWYDKNKDSLE